MEYGPCFRGFFTLPVGSRFGCSGYGFPAGKNRSQKTGGGGGCTHGDRIYLPQLGPFRRSILCRRYPDFFWVFYLLWICSRYPAHMQLVFPEKRQSFRFLYRGHGPGGTLLPSFHS